MKEMPELKKMITCYRFQKNKSKDYNYMSKKKKQFSNQLRTVKRESKKVIKREIEFYKKNNIILDRFQDQKKD